jgi:hypothetical protein
MQCTFCQLASYSQVHPSEFGNHLDLFYLFFNLLLNGPENSEEGANHNQQHAPAYPSEAKPYYRLPQEAVRPLRSNRLDVDAQLEELAHIATIFSKVSARAANLNQEWANRMR